MEQKENSNRERTVDIRERIRRYLELTGVPETKFGRDAVNDPRLVQDIRLGRELGPRISRRIARYLTERGL